MAIRKVTRGKGSGKVFTPQELKKYINGELFELAKIIKEFMIATAERGGRHKFRKDGKSGLWQSTKVDITTDGAYITTAEHAQFVNNGRPAGIKKVPLSALIAWVKRYRITGRDKKTGKYTKNKAARSVASVARAIQQSIYKNGIKARPFLKATLEFMEQEVSKLIDTVMIPNILSIIEFKPKKK